MTIYEIIVILVLILIGTMNMEKISKKYKIAIVLMTFCILNVSFAYFYFVGPR